MTRSNMRFQVADNTLVVITGDNGPPEDQCDWGGSKGPFLGKWQKTGQVGLAQNKRVAELAKRVHSTQRNC